MRDVVDQRDISGLHKAIRNNQELADRIRVGIGSGHGRRRGRIVTVFSAKGGCGKTTLATNMAATLADRGSREVCLVDLDLAFGDVAITLQLFPTHSIEHAIGSENSIDAEMLNGLLTRHQR